MIKKLDIQNFKCFSGRVSIELAPLTLIYGQNSAGKTTILQALQMLKYSMGPSRRAHFFPLPGYENLQFDDFVHRGDTTKKIEIGIAVKHDDASVFVWHAKGFDDAGDSKWKQVEKYLADNLCDEIGPIRRLRPPEGVKPTMADLEYGVLQLQKKSDGLARLNNDLAALGIAYEVRCETIESAREMAYVNLLPLQNGGEGGGVHPSMVGYGVSQIMPILVVCHYHEGKTITIQQPELHIHPAMQSELGSFLVDIAAKRKQNQLLVETHSEHILLRVQRLIRRGDVDPKDVALLFVGEGPDGVEVRRIALRTDGSLSEWPDGFLADRAEEVYGD